MVCVGGGEDGIEGEVVGAGWENWTRLVGLKGLGGRTTYSSLLEMAAKM